MVHVQADAVGDVLQPDAIYAEFTEVPEVRLFTHWLRVMSVDVKLSNGQSVPLYMVAGAMYRQRQQWQR